MGFTRKIEFTPAFDCRNPDPAKNYGIHGVTIRFLLYGEKGVIQFVVYTNWHLKHVRAEIEPSWPLAADIGYHSPVPTYKDQKPLTESCSILDGKPCYYDGSSLSADPILDILIEQGEEAMWKDLEHWYDSVFERND